MSIFATCYNIEFLAMFTLNLKGITQETWNQFHFFTKQGSRNELVGVIPLNFESPIYLRRSTSDIDNFIQIYLKKEYDFLPETPNTILDLGGYIGLASTYLAHKYPDARIILAEPDPDNFIIAQLNCRQFPRIECLNAGVWPKTCDLTISGKVNGDWGTMLREVSENEEVNPRIKAMTVPDIMSHKDFKQIDFLKIDIEGSERILFSHPDSKSWIRKSMVISCELHDRMVEGCSEAFHNAIANEGFVQGRHGEFDYYVRAKNIQ